ncbi:hypothetical protein HWX16_23375 [Ochrobactrum intermedium]|uniref:hypothetical protein n=1 Tax=Brucella intermedia TaxID=94625 RepID=UPI00159C9C66|nr:hypothetical protein [Brucella intermedia]NVM43225.1 hypothetical protein [Brucella intermedia]
MVAVVLAAIKEVVAIGAVLMRRIELAALAIARGSIGFVANFSSMDELIVS